MTVNVGDLGADYVTRKDPKVLHAHNVSYVYRYITRGNSYKTLKAAERDELLAAGISIGLVWETGTDAINGGATQGTLDGREAAKQATLIGYPMSCDILAAVDTDIVAGNLAKCEAYLRAFHANCRPYGMGLYGDEDAYNCIIDVCGVWCLPNASGWSPNYRLYVRTKGAEGRRFLGHILQGHEDRTLGMDYPNLCVKSFNAWSIHTDPKPDPPVPHPPIPTFPPILEEDDMPYYATNTQEWNGFAPLGVKWVLEAGHLRHLEEPEWKVRGQPAGVPLTNLELSSLGA